MNTGSPITPITSRCSAADRALAGECDMLLTPASFGKRHDFPRCRGSFESGISCRDYASAAEKRLDGRLAEEAAAR